MKIISECSRAKHWLNEFREQLTFKLYRLRNLFGLSAWLGIVNPKEVALDFWRTLYFCPAFEENREPNLSAMKILRVPAPKGIDTTQFNRNFVDYCNVLKNSDALGFANAIVSEYGGTITEEALAELEALRQLVANNKRPYPGIGEALTYLRQNVGKVWIASNDAFFYRVEINKRLGKSLRMAICSCDVGAVKPTREFFERAAAKRGIRLCQMLFIDDNLENVLAAMNCGVHAILIVRHDSRVKAIPRGVRVVHSLDEVVLAFKLLFAVRTLLGTGKRNKK